MYMHHLEESHISSVTSNIDMEFVASNENEEVSATSERHYLLTLTL